ncbi:uncharacterized protein [Macrobrachium rosenbergii]|uniref:uncharacterized protein n=1 Tax=Macrobrachium rosenbergii TaxID=79674 RepID=UPI0034D6E52D
MVQIKQTSKPDKIRLLEFVPPKQLGKQKLLVNFAVNPVGYKFDPLNDIFPDSCVEHGLDNFYNLESIGIKDENSLPYEDQQVAEFAKSISYHGHHHVQLPWKKDLIEKVPNNLKISLAVAERIYSKLEDQNISSKYEEVFDRQEELGIIEPVKNRAAGQVFIPHRPVIRKDENATTKIRPVFNCSLKKVGKAPSLNEAAFPGIDLMNNLLSLVLYFRNNDYVVIADIVKAFLQVRLSLESDQK